MNDNEIRAECERILRMYPREEVRSSVEASFRVVDVLALLDRLQESQQMRSATSKLARMAENDADTFEVRIAGLERERDDAKRDADIYRERYEQKHDEHTAYQIEVRHQLSVTMAILRLENAPAESWSTIQASLKALLSSLGVATKRADTLQQELVKAVECQLQMQERLRATEERLVQAIERAESVGAYVGDLRALVKTMKEEQNAD